MNALVEFTKHLGVELDDYKKRVLITLHHNYIKERIMSLDKDFLVTVTKPDGTAKELYYSNIISVIIERNDDAKGVMAIFTAADKIKAGEEVSGDDINMKGYTFKKKG